MRVTVTGGAGNLGQVLVNELIVRSHNVTNLDLVPSTAPSVRNIIGTVLDLQTVLEAVKDAEAIVHLAAISANGIKPDHETFSFNTTAAYVVHEAARKANVARVVLMSSEAVLGWAPHARDHAPLPDYLPIDEGHPCRAADAYGLSKLVAERTAQSFAERGDHSVIVLRPPWVIDDDQFARLAAENGFKPTKFSLLHYIHQYDLARACAAAIEVPHSGFDAVFVGSGESLVAEPLAELFPRLVPELRDKARCIADDMGPVSIERARELLSWSPQLKWKSVAKERVQ